jgi:hypothetical protein
MAGVGWEDSTWPGSLIHTAGLSFTYGGPAFPVLISFSYFCSSFKVMRNNWLLSSTTLKPSVTCPSSGRYFFCPYIALGCSHSRFRIPLYSIGQLFWPCLLASVISQTYWIHMEEQGATINCISSCTLSSKQIKRCKQMNIIVCFELLLCANSH